MLSCWMSDLDERPTAAGLAQLLAEMAQDGQLHMNFSLTAAAGELEIEINGQAGHGARPHQSVDAIWIASRVVTGLQEAISRRLDALDPVVVSFGRIEGGKAFNVIADRVSLLGTVRCLSNDVHDQLPCWIE